MEKRKLKILFNKDGYGNYSTKISLPKLWIQDMNLSLEKREVLVSYDKEKKEINIKKIKE